MKRILITGQNSYVGNAVEKWLIKDEYFSVHTVSTLNCEWKLEDFSQYDVVFHVAGIAHVDAKKNMEDLYYKVNRDLTFEIAQHAKKCGVKQFIFMSSMIVYGESKSLKANCINKETIEKPNGFYGNSKLEAEKLLFSIEDDSFRVVCLRPPMIYGPNSKGNFPRLEKLSRKTPIFPNISNKRSMIYIDNLCEFIKQIILREKRGVYFPQNSCYSNTSDIVRIIAKQYNHKIWISKLFNIFVYMGSPIINSINKLFASFYYDQDLSKVDFDYDVVNFEESIINSCK